ncbi:MAG: Transcriptional regulator, MarR family, partial [uncultured Actinomycetospora sp.]
GFRAGATLARSRRVARVAQLHRGPGAAGRTPQPRAVRRPRPLARRLRDPRAPLRAAGPPDADEPARRRGRRVEVAAVPPGLAARGRRPGAPRALPVRRPRGVRGPHRQGLRPAPARRSRPPRGRARPLRRPARRPRAQGHRRRLRARPDQAARRLL